MRVSTMATLALLAAPAMASAQCPDGRPAESCPRAPKAAPPPQNVRARQIVLLPFRNVTRTPANDWLVTGAPLLLGEILGQYRDLNVVPEPRLTAARRRLGISSDSVPDEAQRRRIAEETGGWTSITGSVLALGNTLRISADAFDAASGSVIARASAEAPAGADIRPVFDRLALQLLKPAGVAQSGTPTDVVALTTRSIDAYRAYTQGIALMQRGAYQRSETAFREAVRLDTNFALAWVKLGTVAIAARGLADLLSPFGTAAMAIERAARATSYVPPRTAAGVRAIRHVFHGEIAESRALADSLVATDPEDIDARHWLATIHFFDSRLDSLTGRRRGSLNESIVQSKWVLNRDPGREEVYFIPAVIYGFGAGFFGGSAGGRLKPVPNLISEFLTPSTVSFRVIVGDSISLVPDSLYWRWSAAERDAAKRRAVDAGRTWSQQWMAVNPTNGDPHLWASRFEELGGDFAKSLEEFDRGMALGSESNFEAVRARRLYLYEMTGRFTEAEKIADSLLAAGPLPNPFNSWMDRSRVIVPAVLMRTKQWARLATLGAQLDTAATPCSAIENAMAARSVTIPTPTLRALSDTVANHFIEAWRATGRCAGDWAWGLGPGPFPQRPASARKIVAAAESLYRSGDAAGAYLGARTAVFIDSTRRSSLRQTPWVDTISRRFEVGTRFASGRAVVEGDSLTITFPMTGPEPLLIETPAAVFNRLFWFSTARTGPDSSRVLVQLLRIGKRSDSERLGSLVDFASSFTSTTAFSGAPGKDTAEADVVVTSGSGALIAVVRGPILKDLLRLKPASGRMQASCAISTAGLCTPQTVTIEYR